LYGVIEKRIVDFLGLEHDSYRLNSGARAAIVNRNEFIIILCTLRHIHMSMGLSHGTYPQEIMSDISGLRTLLTVFYHDDDVLDGLTPGQAKESLIYINIKNLGHGENRFNCSQYLQLLNEWKTEFRIPEHAFNNDVLLGIVNRMRTIIANEESVFMANEEHRDQIEIIENAIRVPIEQNPEQTERIHAAPNPIDNGSYIHIVPTPSTDTTISTTFKTPTILEEPVEMAKQKTLKDKDVPVDIEEIERRKELNRILQGKVSIEKILYTDFGISVMPWKLSPNETSGIMISSANISVSLDPITQEIWDIAILNKKLVYLIKVSSPRRSSMANLVATIKSANMKDNVIIIMTPPILPNLLVTECSVMCFGSRLTSIHKIKISDVNQAINDIQNNRTLADEERNKRLDLELAKASLSTYNRFDDTYRDYVTNVLYAIREQNIIHLMVTTADQLLYKRMILEILYRSCGGSIKDSKKRCVELYKKMNDDAEKHFIDFYKTSTNNVIQDLKMNYSDFRAQYEENMKIAMEAGKNMFSLMKQIDAFDEEKYYAELTKEAKEAYTSTLELKKVSRIHIENDLVHVYTNTLFAKDDRTNRMHEMGTFHITINMSTTKYDTHNTVHIKNTKHVITAYEEGMNAPHVFHNGVICHGNLAQMMMQAYAKRDLYQIILQIILFLQTANTDDAAGRYVNVWPMVNQDYIKRTEEEESKDVIITEEPKSEKELQFDDLMASAIPVTIK